MQLTGIYDLVAVLTHKGRSADSGHYVAWVKQDTGASSKPTTSLFRHIYLPFFNLIIIIYGETPTGKWILFDDDNPTTQREEDITKLSGGGKSA